MALKKEVLAILNKQIEMEMDASAVYHGMHIYFEKELLKGLSAWFKKQTAEERSHAEKLIGYILDRNASPALPAVAAPKTDYASPLDALKGAVAHERANTGGIYACLETANKAKDPATAEMLQWFVKEQVEEEQWAEEFTAMLEKVQQSIGGLYAFDHRVAKMAFGG